MMNPSAYLERIHYSGPLEANLETLRALHRAHLYSVPFENLDISLGRPIRLEEEALFDKIVTRRRGGFCYELNGLFARLLRAIGTASGPKAPAELRSVGAAGFGVTLLNARGLNDDGSYAIEFDHLALAVSIPGEKDTRWLADVGFGDGPLEPVRLVEGVEQRQGERVFKLITENEYLVLTEFVAREDGRREWIKHYAFTLQPRSYADFFAACRYHSTSPTSMFTQKRLCTLFLPDGRVTLSNSRLITTRDGAREERELGSEEAVRQALREIFAIEL